MAIASATERLSSDQVESAFTLLALYSDWKAKLAITVMAKSCIVARFLSIGLMALFLNPTDSVHGQLAMVAP